jgi:maleate isomerase
MAHTRLLNLLNASTQIVATSRRYVLPTAVRRRVGLLVPATNSTAEPDFHMAVPEGVTVHSHRLWIESDSAKASTMDGMNAQLASAAKHVSALKPDVICMAGTTNSFYRGIAESRWMEEEMSKAAGVPAVSSSPSVTHALWHYGVHRISVATPYTKWKQ